MEGLPKLTLMSTSNGLMRGGINSKLAEYFNLNNVSKGACSSGLGLYTLASHENIFDSDYIIVDFAINDNEHLKQGWINESHLEEVADRLYSILSLSGVKVFVLLMPVYTYLSDPLKSEGVKLHLKLAEKYNFQVINGYDFVASSSLEDKSSMFVDFAHLDRVTASTFGDVIADHILQNYPTSNKTPTTPTFELSEVIRALLPDSFETSGTYTSKGSSVGMYECIELRESETINISVPSEFYVNGIMVNANSKAKISIDTGKEIIVKDIYSGGLSDDKVEVKYIPFQTPLSCKNLTIKIADFGDEVTEKSPRSRKKLSSQHYGHADIFGVLISREEFTLPHVLDRSDYSGCLPSFRPVNSARLKLLDEFEDAVNKSAYGEMADLLRELSLVFERHNRYLSAEKTIHLAEKLRPEGPVIKGIKNRISKVAKQRKLLFKQK
ncbi:SGNH/GDSL hydrolase family protein [Vibrio natriegens]|uniref:Uncharacterized protein n=1 Tax=Vibrio natriegens NBRC 15636 = ATCC 14048 = DSM 759 TaxID=1219067 RepID=A0AAN0Y2E0_VIBNA|nr:SGNH/GDSL hydrolase family protein [Vibrio natriegens]ALR15720.1 hypothetical protein PN96_06880 [Vibrio natriegens NBRC 15636 = ATCC 14048 = DSM 759]ANQ12422.1 hypothetical protein BA890_06470 [Vibrio natriegens NBRC 15636 = ATCC 14048 = DSM 759]EPM42481.1 hypothetical protein M272_00515 [Vibrio natriegens NBRC 15636 = ATCC 14048 = DSM 759]MDX6026803.1 SGNH/GDSL hydrolase family protein [Vibrio natriegens NBRC 15636 = ATCC 14048 = DSM 759]UUI12885.1 SGNH/GDSL hydrolase family protein [Vibr